MLGLGKVQHNSNPAIISGVWVSIMSLVDRRLIPQTRTESTRQASPTFASPARSRDIGLYY